MIAAIVILSVMLLACAVALAYMVAQRHSAASRIDEEERFRMMATEIFSQNSRQFRQDSEQRLSELITPVITDLIDFRAAFTESYSREQRERYSLQERLRELISLNDTIGREARELTSALKGNSRVQGQWGEMILQNILERSGLRRGEEYTMQESVVTPDGQRLRADAVITYPDGRHLVIDSKVSISDYLELTRCSDPAAQAVIARRHVASVRNHINELKNKNYQDYIGTERADFVLMFIPNEGAYLAAMQTDDSLWQYAYDNRVIIVSPTHLMAVVKLVEQTWRHERQNRNAMEIATEGGRLIDKLAAFLADMEKMEASLDAARRAYQAAYTKLDGKGGIISKAEKLRDLGAKASRPLTTKN